jgi:cellulose synthase (UDP-forming)
MEARLVKESRSEKERRVDPRLGDADWRIPSEAATRLRARVVAVLCLATGAWYLGWLLQGRRIGEPLLYGLLIAAEAFNLLQAAGFWWTVSHQLVRLPGSPGTGAKPREAGARPPLVDVMIPVYNEPVAVVGPTVEAATRLRGADVTVWLLDDGPSAEMRALANRTGARYVVRPDRRGAKAGNLNHALALSEAPYVLVLDCDHVPRPWLLERTLPALLADDGIAFVQSPQYYANRDRSPVAAAAAAQQSLFFGPIARGKAGLGAMFCCGTNMLLARAALDDVGGFPERSLTEDFELSVLMHARGWRTVYHPEVLALGLGPEDVASYVRQQQRWARGCLAAIPTVLRARLPWRLRIQYLLSASYFLSGWTLLIYMSMPVVRILTGAQPLAGTSADQFLLHFAPYYCSALGAVAVAGEGSYTFAAFALSASSFWIHVQSTLKALLRLPARFMVTPKERQHGRQPRAVAPTLVTIGLLVGTALYGLAVSRSAATLNNVAFAALHTSVLLIGVLPALRIGRSAALTPETPRRPPAARRRWRGPALAGAVAGCFVVPVAISAVGYHALGPPLTLPSKARDAAVRFMSDYVGPDGRTVRRDQGGDTVSEGQAYAMLLAVGLDNRARFESVWSWTRAHMREPNGLLASRWANGAVVDPQPATDADLDAARALVLAAQRFHVPAYGRQGVALSRAVLARETTNVNRRPVLIAGPWASDPVVINPSYFSPRAYADLDHAAADPRWGRLEATSRLISAQLASGADALAPDWASLPSSSQLVARAAPGPSPATTYPSAPVTGLDAMRVSVRMGESCEPADRKRAAAMWQALRPAPGRARYARNGTPLTDQVHAASIVAAAAAARAAGDAAASNRLLDQAERLDKEHPSYYGAAWLALGRMMLTSSALGGCAG